MISQTIEIGECFLVETPGGRSVVMRCIASAAGSTDRKSRMVRVSEFWDISILESKKPNGVPILVAMHGTAGWTSLGAKSINDLYDFPTQLGWPRYAKKCHLPEFDLEVQDVDPVTTGLKRISFEKASASDLVFITLIGDLLAVLNRIDELTRLGYQTRMEQILSLPKDPHAAKIRRIGLLSS